MARESKLPLGVKAETVARYLAGGALAGAGTAAAINLVQLIKEMDRRRAEAKQPSETDESTIVLTLPKKADTSLSYAGPPARFVLPAYGAQPAGTNKTDGNVGYEYVGEPPPSNGRVDPEQGMAVDDSPRQLKTGKIEKNDIKITVKPGKAHPQLRQHNGTFGHSVKQGNWPTLTFSLLATGAGGGLGYMLVDKIYENRRLKQKQQELDTARTEYLDLLGQKQSTALEKAAARDQTFNLIDMPLGITALALLLGSGGTAYITKKILEESDKAQLPKLPKPQVKRIIFQSPVGQSEIGEAKAAQAQSEVFDAALGIFCDIVSGEPRVLGHEKVAAYYAEHGGDPADLVKLAVSDFDKLMATLRAPENRPLRQLLERAGMESHKVLRHFRWATKLPVLEGMADRKLYDLVTQAFKPGTPAPLKQVVAHVLAGVHPELLKEAGLLAGLSPNLASIMASFYGSTLAKKVDEETPPVPAETPEAVAGEPAAAGTPVAAATADPEERSRQILEALEVDAADPAAADFVIKNQAKIQRLLHRMAREGKL